VTAARDVAADVLLALAVLLVLVSSLGVLLMRDVLQKLHYVAPAAVAAPVFVALAVLLQQGWSAQTTDCWLVLGFLVATGPVLTHATARAARNRHAGHWIQPGDPLDISPPAKPWWRR
jgi:monovalent cation/proton antiporter MnhG/PhaG subunit